MNASHIRVPAIFTIICICIGCANVVPPTGGKKDVTPPKLVEVYPADSQLNTRVTEIEMQFDEFLNLNSPSKEIQMSPLLPFPLSTVLNGKKLTVKIPDSLLKKNTTYRIGFGDAIQDLNENNTLEGFSYIFSTGSYFDSLKLHGRVYQAATGMPAGNVNILLYDAELSDSAVVKQKPEYVIKTTDAGQFILPGLPGKSFRIYALKDANENLVYDGDDEEIAFIDSLVFPVDTLREPLTLRIFKEIAPLDTLGDDDTTASGNNRPGSRKDSRKGRFGKSRDERLNSEELIYSVAVDTADTAKRTFDVNKNVKVTFNQPIDTYYTSRMSLSYDSSGRETDVGFTVTRDTTDEILFVDADWQEDKIYTLRILKDFVTDTAERTSVPSKHIFRTLSGDDYGIININASGKYYGDGYLLQVIKDKDTVYNQPILDSAVSIRRLLPATYNIFIIVDENKNGKWDTGDLFAKQQPEVVIPYNSPIELRAGWENVIDFVVPVSEPDTTGGKASRGKRDRPGAK